ncbi:MAG TPA: peptidoglycan editing factor PgeF [Anaerolineales bacterium]|nr:peptidoglycan editing factor PgeF [Anaerolineales bacterium]HRF49549.1 peptidoglycan editing factor PgeF [Anaerolineales bacterium]
MNATQPAGDLTRAEHGGLIFYHVAAWAGLPLVHGFTTRHGGVSPEPFAGLNLSISVGDTRANVVENRRRVFTALGRAPDSIADLWQVHSADVIYATAPRAPGQDHHGKADALITDRPEVTLFLRFADCVPILLYDRARHVIGLVHAGWRGTVSGVCAATVSALTRQFGTDPTDVVAAIGPSISGPRYEVGPEVVTAAEAILGDRAGEALMSRSGKTHFDLWRANAVVLERAGVSAITIGGLCTADNTHDFYSHRAEQGRTGRFGALLALAQ